MIVERRLGGRTKKQLLFLGFVAGAASIITILAIQAFGDVSVAPTAQANAPAPSEAPAYRVEDVPVPVTPGTVDWSAEESQLYREGFSRPGTFRMDAEPAAGVPLTAHAITRIGGTAWSVTTYRNRDGLFCFGVRAPGGQSIGCQERELFFRDGPLYIGSGRRQADDLKQWNILWASGLTRPPVTGVEIISTDCSREQVHIDADGVFLHLTPPRKIYEGVWPYRVVARTAEGKVVAEKWLPLNPPETDAARAAGVKAPRPQGCQ